MVRRVISMLLMCLFFVCALAACYDAREITEWAYAYSIGFDKGITDKLRLSVQIPTMKRQQGGGGDQMGGAGGQGADIQEKGGYMVITIDCPTFFSGINLINSFLPRELNYMHTSYLVFSESLAREGIDQYITALIRSRQMRREMNLIITKGPSNEFLKENIPAVGTALSKTQQNMMELSRKTGLFESTEYGMFSNKIKTTYSSPIAILAAVNDFSKFQEGSGSGEASYRTSWGYYAGELVRRGGSKVEFLGTAVFDGGKMVGELNGDETRAMLMARGEFKRGFFAFQDPKKPDLLISMDIREQKGPKVKVRFQDGKPIVDLKVSLEGDILAIQSTIDYEDRKLKPILENEVKRLVKGRLDETIRKCQDLNSDVFRFGYVAAMKFSTIQQWEEYNWLKRFKDTEVNTEVEFTIRRTGTKVKSSEIFDIEGKKGE